ncbi:MAG: N-carbamoyl-D-amino-acid hydrolase [Rhodospirillales bacterium]|nr:N-carbamoyl-D-amino-acid hydrolase [Rhodospirillales bacterium]
MARVVRVGAAQVGPIQKAEGRQAVVARLMELMREGKKKGCDLLVYPELTLTTFFPRWYMTDETEVDSWFEKEMPNEATRPLFELSRQLGMGFHLGYAELAKEGGKMHRYNTAILVDKSGKTVGKYRKVHLPGHSEFDPERTHQHLEKRYFEPGNLGFPVWRTMGGVFGMCICNDRRWPEVFRVMGLQGVEMVVLGYNTPNVNSQKPDEKLEQRLFHSNLSMQAGAYQNSTWVVGVAKAGVEDGNPLIAGSVIINPDGRIVAEAKTQDDELVVHDCDLDDTKFGKKTMFNFANHRRVEHYKLIVERTGAIPPP